MAAVGVEEDLAVQAARILLTLRNRRLRQWPEWVQKEPAAMEVQVRWPLERWPKRQRNGNRLRSDCWAAMALPNLGLVAASAPAGSGACSSGEERARSPAPPRWRERSRVGSVRDELMASASTFCYCAPAGSGPPTSADRKARPRQAIEMAAKASPACVTVPPKEPMKASSPETPLDFGAAAARSGASSSGDDGVRQLSKRRALGSGGGASSGDEGCSSPDKRARLDAGDGEKAISEPKTQTPDCEKGVKFKFDLNMPCPEDDECPA